MGFLSRLEHLRPAPRWESPRICVVKQDVHDDLYCCSRGSSARDIVGSTILRTGPVALFSRHHADFLVVETEPDPECNIWQEKWTAKQWAPLDYFESFRERIPGKDHGNGKFAVRAGDIDWNEFDIVISSDVSVPARITREFPKVAWCYYVREIKTPSFARSRGKPIEGQDLHLNHHFRPGRWRNRLPKHEVEFPYHLQYVGCFHDIFGVPFQDGKRAGILLEHHSAAASKSDEFGKLSIFGPVVSTAFDPPGIIIDHSTRPIRRTVDPEYLPHLLNSKYFLKFSGRSTFGTALVEAIAGGALALAVTELTGIDFLFSRHTRIAGLDDAIRRIEAFESDPRLYRREVERQRRMIDAICYRRPIRELFKKAGKVVERRE